MAIKKGKFGNVGITTVTFTESVADNMDGKVGFAVEMVVDSDREIVVATSNDEAIGVVVGKLQEGTGNKEEVQVALIDAGGIVKAKAGAAIQAGHGVSIDTGGDFADQGALDGAKDTIGIALTEANADGDFFELLLSRNNSTIV